MKTSPGSGLNRLLSAVAVFVLLPLGACSSAPPVPTASLERAERTIARAEQGRVIQFAPAELTQARLKLQQARSAVRQKEMVQAERLAYQASLDAELAIARADLVQANTANDEMKENISILQQEMLRNQQGVQP